MKAFIHKLKKSNKIYLSLLGLSLLAYLILYIIFTINLLSLTGIETVIRIIVLTLFGIWFFVWLLSGLVYLFTQKYASFIPMFIFTLIFSFVFAIGSYYINSITSEISSMSKDKITYTTNLITLNDNNFDENSKIGIISDTSNIEANQLAKKLLEKENINNKLYQYEDFYVMLEDLYSQKIDACFVSNNYKVLFSNEEKFANIENEVKVIKSYSEEMKNADNVVFTNKKLTEPFTILVMGVDTTDESLNSSQAFNGDTLMLVTFNPNTLTASMFSIPRDLFVPISCRNNALAKINSSAAYGTSCVINTVKNLTNIDIDYYIKINFKGVVNLVDALGGITVEVEKPYFTFNNGIDYHGQVCEQNSNREFGNHMVCMNPGIQKLNGEQALAYARNRHQYIGSDLDRIRHQQDVVAAIAAEAKNIRSFDEFKAILNAIQKNMDTNLTTEQILSLYNVAKSILISAVNGNDIGLSINKTYLKTYSLPVLYGSSITSALGYYKPSLDEITTMMRTLLEIEETIPNKSFSIDYNEDYTTKYYGKNVSIAGDADKSVILMNNLIGQSEEYATTWAISKGLSVSKITVLPGDNYYNFAMPASVVVGQSIKSSSVITEGNSLTLYINGKTYVQENTIQNNHQSNINDNDNKKEDTNNNNNISKPNNDNQNKDDSSNTNENNNDNDKPENDNKNVNEENKEEDKVTEETLMP